MRVFIHTPASCCDTSHIRLGPTLGPHFSLINSVNTLPQIKSHLRYWGSGFQHISGAGTQCNPLTDPRGRPWSFRGGGDQGPRRLPELTNRVNMLVPSSQVLRPQPETLRPRPGLSDLQSSVEGERGQSQGVRVPSCSKSRETLCFYSQRGLDLNSLRQQKHSPHLTEISCSSAFLPTVAILILKTDQTQKKQVFS